MSEILLCLETGLHDDDNAGVSFSPGCVSEMREHRRMLMEDYRVSPEIVTTCKDDIQTNCGDRKPGGETLHCLMRAASDGHLKGKDCSNALDALLREADVAQNWKVDPILQRNCQEVVDQGCDPKASDDSIMTCLLSLKAKGSRIMNKECKTTLQEIQYFMARDFVLNPKLYKKCRRDAAKFCSADDNWHMDEDAKKKVFPCLVRYLYVDEEEDPSDSFGDLSDDCAEQVEKALERRALSVRLHPEIEDVCRGYLITNCADRTQDGEELQCLQDNLEDLSSDLPECHKAVIQYTRMESRNILLNPLISAACHQVIDDHCKEETSNKDEGKVMHCLLAYQSANAGATGEKCATALEHWQILTLKDWRFSPRFKKMCTEDVQRLCQDQQGNRPRTKVEVLQCLSTVIQVDLIEEHEPPRVSQGCREEIKFGLLQKHSNIKLDPALRSACSSELHSHCVKDRNLECLKKLKHNEMSKQCRQAVFGDEQEEVAMNSIDALLMKTCANEISSHCKDEGRADDILTCLQENQESSANFDPKCRLLVIRRTIQKMSDYRLNPRLQNACAKDLPKFCSSIIERNRDAEKDFLEGKVIQCLKNKFVEDESKLSKSCKRQVESLMRQASVDIRANPEVSSACPNSINKCRQDLHIDNKKILDAGQVEECLKDSFRAKDLKLDPIECYRAVARLIGAESLDIEVDHVLHEACSLDLSKFCRGVSPGSGQQISCLRNVKQDPNLSLEPKCLNILTKRLEMYHLALQQVPMASVQDLYEHLAASPHRHYFLAVLMAFVAGIFVVGLCCGRVTKRVRREMKNK